MKQKKPGTFESRVFVYPNLKKSLRKIYFGTDFINITLKKHYHDKQSEKPHY